MVSHEMFTCMRAYSVVHLVNRWVLDLTLHKKKADVLLILLVIICTEPFPVSRRTEKWGFVHFSSSLVALLAKVSFSLKNRKTYLFCHVRGNLVFWLNFRSRTFILVYQLRVILLLGS